MSHPLKLVLIWLLGGSIAYMLALLHFASVYTAGHYIPFDADGFYHARRILTTIYHPEAFYQYDTQVHAPYGGWISWPWAFDWGLAQFTRLILSLDNSIEPLSILVYIPPLWTYVNAALILGVASALQLSMFYRLLAVLCYAFSILTLELHQLGRIDHHFVEYSFVLSCLWTGLVWLRCPDSKTLAIILGLLLGSATAFHNGLFILQIPLLATLLFLWLWRKELPNTLGLFLLVLIVSTVLVLIPSQPFRVGYFYYYLHSWFHLYVACCTALVAAFLKKMPFSYRNAALLAVICGILLIQLISNSLHSLQYLTAQLPYLADFEEVKSPFPWWFAKHFMDAYTATIFYSGLLWLLPIYLIMASVWFFKTPTPSKLYGFVFTLFGIALLSQQYRLHYFGSFALYLPLLLTAHYLTEFKQSMWLVVRIGLSLGLIASYYPTLSHLNAFYTPLGGDSTYAATYRIYPEMQTACNQQPGVVLAAPGHGHFITFHTQCAVIANNMVATPEDVEQMIRTQRLFALTPEQLRDTESWIRYVYVYLPAEIIPKARAADKTQQGLYRLLLEETAPPGYSLITQISGEQQVVIAKLFKVQP